MPGVPPVMTADTVNCARTAPGRAAAVMTTVPVTPPSAGSRSATLVTSGMGDPGGLAAGEAPRGTPGAWPRSCTAIVTETVSAAVSAMTSSQISGPGRQGRCRSAMPASGRLPVSPRGATGEPGVIR